MEQMQAPRVAILDAERTSREALVAALAGEGLRVVGAAADAETLLSSLGAEGAEVAVVDVPPDAEPSLLRALRAHRPPLPALVLASDPEGTRAERSYRDGASGFLAKRVTSLHELAEAVRALSRGELHFPWGAGSPPEPPPAATPTGWKLQRLTPRERQVLAHVAAGHDNLKIAALLNISERTVKSHVIAVYRKLDAENRVQLALLAGQLGVTPVRS